MTHDSPKMNITDLDGVTVVTLTEQRILDELSISKIGKKLCDLIAQAPVPKIVIDFRNVTNMSSSALGMLITLHKRIREANGQLRLCNIQSTIEEVFKITRLNEIFQICRNQKEAVDSIGS
ncbi:MAG TPA: anti-sigma factor antagonist [Phycisphaerae bacterium]|nr:anti-sigma factor antagonist [Phycisphaerae bacterium]